MSDDVKDLGWNALRYVAVRTITDGWRAGPFSMAELYGHEPELIADTICGAGTGTAILEKVAMTTAVWVAHLPDEDQPRARWVGRVAMEVWLMLLALDVGEAAEVPRELLIEAIAAAGEGEDV